MENKVLVEIGGGDKPRKGFMSFDSREGFNVIFDELPLEDNSVDLIYASHIIEHIPVYVVRDVLKRLYKKLKVGGKIRILCPDMEKIIHAYVNKDYEAFERHNNHWGTVRKQERSLGIGGFFISQLISPGRDSDVSVDGRKICSLGHICGYDFEMLQNVLLQSGFSQVRRTELLSWDTWQEDGQLCVIAIK